MFDVLYELKIVFEEEDDPKGISRNYGSNFIVSAKN